MAEVFYGHFCTPKLAKENHIHSPQGLLSERRDRRSSSFEFTMFMMMGWFQPPVLRNFCCCRNTSNVLLHYFIAMCLQSELSYFLLKMSRRQRAYSLRKSTLLLRPQHFCIPHFGKFSERTRLSICNLFRSVTAVIYNTILSPDREYHISQVILVKTFFISDFVQTTKKQYNQTTTK